MCALAAALIAVAGCSAATVPGGDDPDAEPIKVLPDDDKTGESTVTAPGCSGVTTGGECRAGIAVYCNPAGEGSLREIDCNKLGQQCVSQSSGVACAEIINPDDPQPPPQPDEPCGGIVDFDGFCSSTGNAVWCSLQGEIINRDCAAEGLACSEDECAQGAYCCATEPEPEPLCPALGFYGECDGDVARYCNGLDDQTLVQLDCAAEGKVCALDDCAPGAYCCDAPEPEPEPEPLQCDEIGLEGVCQDNAVHWCNLSGEIQVIDCNEDGLTCKVDECEGLPGGAWCC